MTTSIPLSDLESSPSAKFDNIGDKYAGKITAIAQRPQTDIDTGVVKTFDDGQPRMVWVITIEDEKGESVALYARGGRYVVATGQGESMLNAIGTAVRAANATAVDIGGYLAVAHSGLAEQKPGRNAAKLYVAQYRPPAGASIPAQDLFAS